MLDAKKPITIVLNSSGGSIHAGHVIADCMKSLQCPIITHIVGKAYSAASLIFLLGHSRYISEESKFMIHDATTTTDMAVRYFI